MALELGSRTKPFDCIVAGGRVVTEEGLRATNLALLDGQVAAIGVDPESPSHHRYDAEGKIILPGLIDPHAHFWDPGATHREDWRHGSMSALAGGVTTVVEMPLSIPPTVDVPSLKVKRARVKELAVADVALWGGVVPAPGDELEQRMLSLLAEGITAFKLFMCDAAIEFPACDIQDVMRALQVAKNHGALIGVHAEDARLVHDQEEAEKLAGRGDPIHFANSRPLEGEDKAVADLLNCVEFSGAEAYIVHMSSARAVRSVGAAKRRGTRIYAETCPHYLSLDLDDLRQQGPWAKCAPPLRNRDNMEELWEYVFDGTIDTIGSDHAPFSVEEKQAGESWIWDAPNGLVGIQTMLPVLIQEGINVRGLSWERLAELTSGAAAKIFGLNGKGSIAVGQDADLVVIDPKSPWTVRGEDLLSQMKWTPYEGKSLDAQVVGTFLAGRLVYDGRRVDSTQCFPRLLN